MPQVIRCPHCSRSMQVPDNAAGKQVACPSCRKPFKVPALAAEPVGAAVGAGAAGGGLASPKMSAGVAAAPHSPSVGTASGASSPTGTASATECPACGSSLLPGAIACMDCGYLLQGDASSAEVEGPPNLCTNPNCGVANPPG